MAGGEGTREHKVTVTIGNRTIGGWMSYQIETSMLEPADHFTLTRAFDEAAWRLCVPDASITIAIDGTAVISGFLDDVEDAAREQTMTISGRCRVGRLVQESVSPGLQLEGMLMTDAIKRVADPWFTKIALSNARNRRLVTGKAGHKAAVGNEPLVVDSLKRKGGVDRGMMRWALIEEMLSQAGYVAFSSGDGRELVVASPNYNQSIQFALVQPEPGSKRRATVKDLTQRLSTADRYSEITVQGVGAGDDADYGDRVFYGGRAANGPGPAGIGVDFDRPKRLHLTERAVQSVAEANLIAARELARRDFRAHAITAVCALHGQAVNGGARVLFAPDTLAHVLDERKGPSLDGVYMIHACSYQASRDAGETTTLQLVPKGTRFVQ